MKATRTYRVLENSSLHQEGGMVLANFGKGELAAFPLDEARELKLNILHPDKVYQDPINDNYQCYKFTIPDAEYLK